MKLREKSIRPAILAGFATIISVSASASAAIVLTNPSFEANNIANGAFAANGATGWILSGGTTYLVDNNTTQNAYFDAAVPDGQQANSLAGSYFGQQLFDDVTGAVMTSAVAQTFNIGFSAGVRKGYAPTAAGTFSVILQAYNGNTYAGDLASQKFNLRVDDSIPSTVDLGIVGGNWSSPISLSLTAPANLLPGNNIRLVFAQNFANGSGAEAAIDNVSIAAIPEPSAALLGGLGMLALLRRRR